MDGLFKGPENEALRFFFEAVKNPYQSERNGRSCFDKILYVEVITPGSRESAPVFELERTYCTEAGIEQPQRTERYAKYKAQIDAFLNGEENPDLSGTPLSAWPRIDTAMVASLKEARVYTVEGLVALSDEKLRVIGPGGRALRDSAKAFLEAAAGNAPFERLAAENEELREQVRLLTERVNAASVVTETPPPPPPPPPPAKAGKANDPLAL